VKLQVFKSSVDSEGAHGVRHVLLRLELVVQDADDLSRLVDNVTWRTSEAWSASERGGVRAVGGRRSAVELKTC